MVRFFNGQRFSEEDLHARKILEKLGFNKNETAFLGRRSWAELPLLYLQPYVDRVRDETNPFEAERSRIGSAKRCRIIEARRGVRSRPAVLRRIGSPLQTIWAAAIKKLRGTDLESKKLFSQGRQSANDRCFRCASGGSGSPRLSRYAIEMEPQARPSRSASLDRSANLIQTMSPSCVSAVVLRQFSVSPAWPEAKSFVIREMPYYTRARVVLQSRTRFLEDRQN